MPKYQGEEETKKAPKGQFVVYVGEELRRFTLPLSYLKNPIFQQLLKKSAEEYGYSNSRGIVIPCDESTFERWPFVAENVKAFLIYYYS
ncbi:Auxin-induced protein 15A [Spatholobus suberectus]|nr:Auxin-induced protein 15A [Spatholobus suberectus]